MTKCKYCGQNISRLDKEICPFCGGKKPLDGTDTTTQDITKVVDSIDHPVEIKHKKRVITAIFAFLLGFLGIHEFYLGKMKKGLIALGCSLGLIACIGLILFFAIQVPQILYNLNILTVFPPRVNVFSSFIPKYCQSVFQPNQSPWLLVQSPPI